MSNPDEMLEEVEKILDSRTKNGQIEYHGKDWVLKKISGNPWSIWNA